MKLNIPQLALAKLTQSGRHQSKTQEVSGSIPTVDNFFAVFLLFPMQVFIDNIALLTDPQMFL